MYVLKCIHQRLKWYSAIAQHTSHSITQAQVCPLRNRNSYDHVINSKNIFSTTSQNIVDFSSIVYLQCRRSTPFASVFFLKGLTKNCILWNILDYENLYHGRLLSVSGRPCYILPLFLFYLFIFYGRLILRPWLTKFRESFTRGGPWVSLEKLLLGFFPGHP